MSAIEDGGSAFPTVPQCHGYLPDSPGAGTGCSPGMSLRAFFAAHALNGLLACAETAPMRHDQIATCAVDYADALIAELKKGGGK